MDTMTACIHMQDTHWKLSFHRFPVEVPSLELPEPEVLWESLLPPLLESLLSLFVQQ